MKITFAGFAVFLIPLFSGCSTPDYVPETPEGLRVEVTGYNVELYCSYSENTEFMDVYCRGPAQGQLEYYMSKKVAYMPASFTFDGAGLAMWGGLTTPPATYYFAVKARNSFGSSDMSPVVGVDLSFSQPPDTPTAVASLGIFPVWGNVWGNPNVYVQFSPVEPGMVYNITVGGNTVYNDYSPMVINGFPCFLIPKSYIPPGGGPYIVTIVVKNKYTGNTASSSVSLPAPPVKPGVMLASPTVTSAYVELWHDPIDYSPQFEVFHDSTASFTPSDANRLPGLYTTNGNCIRVLEDQFFPGTHYIKVRAVGTYDTGDYSNEIGLNFSPTITLVSANPIASDVELVYTPIGYLPQVKVFYSSSPSLTPSDVNINQISGLYTAITGGSIRAPRKVFPGAGTYYIRVRAEGTDIGASYSNEITLTLP
jgi:hypothetical protein